MFDEEGGDFRIINFKGDYAYIERDSQYEESPGDIYRLNLKTCRLEWVNNSYYNSVWDICQEHLVFSLYNADDDETTTNFEEIF